MLDALQLYFAFIFTYVGAVQVWRGFLVVVLFLNSIYFYFGFHEDNLPPSYVVNTFHDFLFLVDNFTFFFFSNMRIEKDLKIVTTTVCQESSIVIFPQIFDVFLMENISLDIQSAKVLNMKFFSIDSSFLILPQYFSSNFSII